MNLFRIPKRAVWAKALVAGMPPVKVRLFLGERARTHSGFERPSDLLNGGTDFIPGIDEGGSMMVLRRTSVLALSVPRDEEGEDQLDLEDEPSELGEVTRIPMQIVFESGDSVRGLVAFVQPEARRRLPDFLNDASEFFQVHDGETVHIVNKRRIASATVAR